MSRVETPQSRCRAALARADITPPVGIYHRMWGAALHDRATGVHRPLTATLLWLAPAEVEHEAPQAAQVIVGLDHCILDAAELRGMRESLAAATGISADQVVISLSHTHGSGWMSRTRSDLPGGELVGPYLDELRRQVTEMGVAAQKQLAPATIVYGTGRCTLAAHRDFWDESLGRFVCGFHPAGPADDTLLVGRITDESGAVLGTVVNYACHPTTLAWENTRISPDWVGAMRETVERELGGPCLFLQGASGELGPREGFVGDAAVADRNGRQVGHAALAALLALPPAGTDYQYAGAVLSGATLGTWRHVPLSSEKCRTHEQWAWRERVVPLAYRADLPTIPQTAAERETWLAEETRAREAGDETRLRDCRAQVEQRTRQLARLAALVPGESYPLAVRVGRIGDALWVFTPGELYQVFQTALRTRFAPRPVLVATLTNDWQPGYVPPAAVYGKGIYQEVIAATAPGSLERLIEEVGLELERLIGAEA